MSAAFYAQPSALTILPTPPAAVNIASSTNASPTVITTSTAHGLQTGMVAVLAGHLVNTAVNGLFIVTATGSDTFKISTFAGFPGTFVNGVGAGVGTGTVQAIAFPGITLPEDAVDARDASSVNVPLEALADMTGYLLAHQYLELRQQHYTLPDADTVLGMNHFLLKVPDVTASPTTYTLPSPTGVQAINRRVCFHFFRTKDDDDNGDARVEYGATAAVLLGSSGGPSWVRFESTTLNAYDITAWGGNVSIV